LPGKRQHVFAARAAASSIASSSVSLSAPAPNFSSAPAALADGGARSRFGVGGIFEGVGHAAELD